VGDAMKHINSALKTLILLALFLTTAANGQTAAQKKAFDNEKVILISKFIKNVTWPNQVSGDKFVIGVYGDRPFYNFVQDYYIDKTVTGEDVTVVFVDSSATAKMVNLLYVPPAHQRKLERLASQVSGHNVLVMGESRKPIPAIMINLITDEEKLKIAVQIDYAAIEDDELLIPEASDYLSAGHDDDLFTLRQSTIDRNQRVQRIQTLEQQVADQQDQIAQMTTQLDTANKTSGDIEQSSQQQLNEIVQLKASIAKNKQTIAALKKESAQAIAKLEKKNKQLQSENEELAATNKKIIASGEETAAALPAVEAVDPEQIAALEASISEQKAIVAQQVKELKVAKDENQQLATLGNMFYILLIIAIAAVVIALAVTFMWLRYKSTVASTLVIREQQLLKAENVTMLGYLATDTTYTAAESLEEIVEEKGSAELLPTIALLNNLNSIVADLDESDKKSFNIAEYFNKLTSLFADDFEQSEIKYNYKGPSEIVVNSIPSQVALVLINLINNSIKHGFNNNGKGNISLTMEATKSGGVSIVYTDDGKGMDEDTQKQIFKPFFTTKPERGYVGLGMSNTYALINDNLAGSITLDSQLSRGTTFTITL